MRIGIVGALGRMGRHLVDAVLGEPSVSLGGALVKNTHPFHKRAVIELFPAAPTPLAFEGTLEDILPHIDALIDFSSPATLRTLAPQLAAWKKCAWVVGTTGLSDEDMALLHTTARHVPVLQSGNMSLGINLLLSLIRQAAQQLGPDFDIEVLEMHHRHKVDAPSGTALMLGDAAAQGRGATLSDLRLPERDGITGARPAQGIGFATLRGGAVVGDHSVLFAGESEMITLSHRALDRGLFARGAVRAAQWIAPQKAGFYTMEDVLSASLPSSKA